MKTIQTVLVANRGEIAVRVMRTAKAMGLKTVAVYSDADADALHVRTADLAVPLGGNTAAESYLVGEAILEAARTTGADAIHPGYGFLSREHRFCCGLCRSGGHLYRPTRPGRKDYGRQGARQTRDAGGQGTLHPGLSG